MGRREGSLAILVKESVPCVLFEDEHLLVVNKPAGLNTHAPSPHAGEGIFDWLRHRQPRWASLAIMHRLDKDTSGILLFTKTALANRSVTRQFTERSVRKRYFMLTDRPVPTPRLTAVSELVRTGERYRSRPLPAGGHRAETRFEVVSSNAGITLVAAEPVTGKTHQIRVHAAEQGFAILGDDLYGGTSASRLCLHAAELTLDHPVTGATRTWSVAPDFESDPGLSLRGGIIDRDETNVCRLVHGAADGWPGWYVDRLGDFILSQSEAGWLDQPHRLITAWMQKGSCRGVYHKVLNRQVARAGVAESCPAHVMGTLAPESLTVRENGVTFELRLGEGYSVGLFLDQRDNRRRLLTGHVARDFPLFESRPAAPALLNAFAYTCGFSVCGAAAGARVTSLDLSKKYLEWGKRNFVLNALDPAAHEFIYGDVFDWFARLTKKGRAFDVILLDPPTFSRSRDSGVFQVERDYDQLVRAAVPLLRKPGVLLASANSLRWAPEKFLETVTSAIVTQGRRVARSHYQPQPPDFPVCREEPAYLKTVWLRVE